jgi:hypothetical protein
MAAKRKIPAPSGNQTTIIQPAAGQFHVLAKLKAEVLNFH